MQQLLQAVVRDQSHSDGACVLKEKNLTYVGCTSNTIEKAFSEDL